MYIVQECDDGIYGKVIGLFFDAQSAEDCANEWSNETECEVFFVHSDLNE